MTPLQLCEIKADAVVVQTYPLYQLNPPVILLTDIKRLCVLVYNYISFNKKKSFTTRSALKHTSNQPHNYPYTHMIRCIFI